MFIFALFIGTFQNYTKTNSLSGNFSTDRQRESHMKGKSTLHHNTLSHKRGTDTQGNAMAQTKKNQQYTTH